MCWVGSFTAQKANDKETPVLKPALDTEQRESCFRAGDSSSFHKMISSMADSRSLCGKPSKRETPGQPAAALLNRTYSCIGDWRFAVSLPRWARATLQRLNALTLYVLIST